MDDVRCHRDGRCDVIVHQVGIHSRNSFAFCFLLFGFAKLCVDRVVRCDVIVNPMYVMFVVHQVGVDNHETVLVFWVLGFASCVHTTNLVDDDIANMVHCSWTDLRRSLGA